MNLLVSPRVALPDRKMRPGTPYIALTVLPPFSSEFHREPVSRAGATGDLVVADESNSPLETFLAWTMRQFT